MKQRASLSRNYIYNLFYQALALAVPLVTTPYITRVLGPAGLGDYAYTSAMVSYFGIAAALGTVTYAQREIAVCQNSEQGRSRIFFEILFLRLFMVGVVGAAYAVFLLFTTEYRILYLIQICTVVSWGFDISWFFQGMEDFRVTVVRNSAVKLMGLILIFLLVKKKEDLWIYTLILCGSALLGNMTMWPFLKGYIKKQPLRELRPLRHLRGSLVLFVSVVSVQIYTVLDQTMLGSMVNTTQVGYYSQAVKIINIGSSVLASLNTVFMPRIAALWAEKKKEKAGEYFRKIVYFGWLLNLPMMLGLTAVARYLVPVFLGEDFLPCISILRILSLIFVTQGMGQIAGTLLVAMKRQKEYTIAVTAGAVINLCCNSFLIPVWGADGAATASIAAEVCVEILMFHYISSDFEVRVLGEGFLNYLLPACGMAAVVFAASYFLPVTLASLAALVILGCACYGGILLAGKDSFFAGLLHRSI